MDPNETLKMIRRHLDNSHYALAFEKFAELDEWLSKGGFLPDDWRTVEPMSKDKDGPKRGTDKEIEKAYKEYEKALREYREKNPKGGKDS